jgi:hypothetical protein
MPGYRKIMFICWLGISQYVHGQTLINQTNFFIPAGLEVHLDGDFVNEGFIQNQGSFFVTGNWKNTNVYQGTGSVVLNGDLEQRFFNNKNAVFHFVVDGSGPKYINDKLPVTNRLDLVLGVVNVTDADTLLLADGATVNGGSTESYIEGALTHDGTGYKFFPIGKNGRYYPVEMLNITGIKPVTEMEVFENTSPLSVPSPITLYSTTYWQRKNISGTFISSPVSLGYPVPADYTNRHVLDILQSDALDKEFSSLGNARVEYGNTIPSVISDNGATGNLFVLGESIPVGGIQGEFYLSTSLSPAALEPDNRYVKVFGNRLVEGGFQFRVFNRWGLMVFESTSLPNMISTGWDGKHKGESLPSGAYPYIIKAVNANGEVIERKGVISVIN